MYVHKCKHQTYPTLCYTAIAIVFVFYFYCSIATKSTNNFYVSYCTTYHYRNSSYIKLFNLYVYIFTSWKDNTHDEGT